MIRTKVTEIKGLIYRGIEHTVRIMKLKPVKGKMYKYRGIDYRAKPTLKRRKADLVYRGIKFKG